MVLLRHHKTDIIAHSSRKISMVRHAKTHQSPPYTTTKFLFSTLQAASLIFGGCQIAIDLLWLAYNRIRFHEKNLDNIIKKSNKRQRIYNRHKIWVFNQLESLSLLGNFVVTKYKNKIHIEHTSSLVMGNGLIDLQ